MYSKILLFSLLSYLLRMIKLVDGLRYIHRHLGVVVFALLPLAYSNGNTNDDYWKS